MQINSSVEPLVREAFAASLGRDPQRSAAAVQAMADGGDQVVRDSVTLASLIASTALLDLSDGEAPDEDELQELVKSLLEMEAWAGIEPPDARSLLQALSGETDRPILPPETYTRIIFVVGAWLLASFEPEDRTWYDYLDQILTRLEAGSGAAAEK
jgi:hypothetical protein